MAQPKPHPTIQAVIEGDVHGQVAVGENIIQIGTMHGGVVLAGDRKIVPERIAPPVEIRPRAPGGFLDRDGERAGVLAAVEAGRSVQTHGEPGIGKSSLLRQLAQGPVLEQYPDGLVFLSAGGQPPEDLRQLLFDAFYDTELPFKAREGDLIKRLRPVRALVLLDDLEWDREHLESLLDLAPNCGFVLSSRERAIGADVDAVALGGLPVEHAARLIERELGRDLTDEERSIARLLAAALQGHPLRILQAAAAARDGSSTLAEVADRIAGAPAEAAGQATETLEPPERRALAVLAVLRGTPLRAEHVATVAGLDAAEGPLTTLERRGLAASTDSGYSTDVTLERVVGDSDEARDWVDRTLAHLADQASAAAKPPDVAPDSEAFRAGARIAAERKEWARVRSFSRALGLFLPGALAWGAWREVLGLSLEAARGLGDRASEAWTLHELGTRAQSLDPATGRAELKQALEIREAIGDDVGAAVTRHNLEWVPPVDPGEAAEGDDGGTGNGEPGGGGFDWASPLVRGAAAVLTLGAIGVGVWRLVLSEPGEPSGPEGVALDSATVAFDPATVAFPGQPVGIPADPVVVTLSNGGGALLDSLRVSVTGPDAADFRLDPGGCASVDLAPGDGCPVTVSFTPAAAGTRSAALEVRAWPGGVASTIDLGGEGVGEARVTLEPARVGFDGVLVGEATPVEEIEVRNAGTGSLSLGRLSRRGSGAEHFEIDGGDCEGRVLASEESCVVRVVYAPRARGEHSAVLVLESGADPIGEVGLSGRGTGPVVALDVTEVEFGEVPVRSQERARFALRNEGDGPLEIASVSLEQGEPRSFEVSSSLDRPFDRGRCEGARLDPGEVCVIEVAYVPLGPGDHTGEIVVLHFAEGGRTSVPVSGTGLGLPFAVLLPEEGVDFGSVEVGASNQARAALMNRGLAPLVVEAAMVIGEEDRPGVRFFELRVDDCSGRELAPGEGCTLGMAFVPEDVGEWVAVLEVIDNAGGSPRRIRLIGQGAGAARLVADPPRLLFTPDVAIAAVAPASRRLTVLNEGNASAFIDAITITGSEFERMGECPRVLGPGQSCTFTVGFNASGPGVRRAELVVESPGRDPLIVPLEGTGRSAPPPPPPPPTTPDLVVSRLAAVGQTTMGEPGFVTIPVEVEVRNVGATTATPFKLSIESTDNFTFAFTVPGQTSRFYPFVDGLGTNGSRTLVGVVTIRVGDRSSTDLFAVVDSCSGDEFMPRECRVAEANEGNNRSEVVRFSLRPFR